MNREEYIEVNPTLYREIQNLLYNNEQLQQENKQLKERIKELEEYKWKYEELCK